jgi:UPF0716 family protein affecting phage T7 exclusion
LLLIFPGVVSDAVALVLLLLPRPKAIRTHNPTPEETIIEGEWQREEDKRLK